MTAARPPFPASVLGRQLGIPNLHLKRADEAEEARGWAAEFEAMRPLTPATVAVPTRHGATLAEIYEGYRQLPVARPARLLAASTKMGNPIVWSLARGEDVCTDLDEKEVFQSETSEALATHHAKQGDAAVKAVRATGGWGYAAGDAELVDLASQLERTEMLTAVPAAMAGVAALRFAAKFGRLEPESPHVAVVYARDR